MKTAYSCKLFGAQQVFTGIKDCITLLHSVPGCNFGTLAIHAPSDMSIVRQTTSAMNDEDIVFGGEASLRKALDSVNELYQPKLIALVSGCVSDIIHDDIPSIVKEYNGAAELIYQEAAGFRGTFNDGFEASLLNLIHLMHRDKTSDKGKPVINIIGIGADDPHAAPDAKAFKRLLGPDAELGCVLCCCTLDEVRNAANADLNLVLGRGKLLAEEMQKQFGIPYEMIEYPYGLTGAEELWACLQKHFGIDTSALRAEFEEITLKGLAPVYSYIKSFYGVPVSVIAATGRYGGMRRFLTQELGFDVVCGSAREDVNDMDDFIEKVAATETAVIFGSSYEREISDKMEIPAFYFDYPVFRRVCITDRPFIGAEGTVFLIEALLNELMAYSTPHEGPVSSSCGM